jgi:chromosome segregation ATPase
VDANRQWLVVRNRRLYYTDPDERGSELEAAPAVTEAATEALTDDLGEFRTKYERIKIIDKELAEIDARYDAQLVPLRTSLTSAEEVLAHEADKGRKVREEKSASFHTMAALDLKIEHLTNLLHEARAEKNDLELRIVKASEEIAHEDLHLKPFNQAVSEARDEVEFHNKRRYQAKKPFQQRKDSLLKRIAHKASGMGLTVEEVLRRGARSRDGRLKGVG